MILPFRGHCALVGFCGATQELMRAPSLEIEYLRRVTRLFQVARFADCPMDAAPLAKAGECRRQLSATDDSLLPKTRLLARLELRRARVQP